MLDDAAMIYGDLTGVLRLQSTLVTMISKAVEFGVAGSGAALSELADDVAMIAKYGDPSDLAVVFNKASGVAYLGLPNRASLLFGDLLELQGIAQRLRALEASGGVTGVIRMLYTTTQTVSRNSAGAVIRTSTELDFWEMAAAGASRVTEFKSSIGAFGDSIDEAANKGMRLAQTSDRVVYGVPASLADDLEFKSFWDLFVEELGKRGFAGKLYLERVGTSLTAGL